MQLLWEKPSALLVTFVLGVFLMLAAGQYGKWNHRYTGRTNYYALLGPATLKF